jgi:ABC-type Zn uptake system ZnuABC Zn-binding protein ZnuA
MDTIKQQLDEIKETIKKAEARLQMYEESKNLDMAMKIQDEIIVDKRRLEEKEKQGESQPPGSRKFCSCMAK